MHMQRRNATEKPLASLICSISLKTEAHIFSFAQNQLDFVCFRHHHHHRNWKLSHRSYDDGERWGESFCFVSFRFMKLFLAFFSWLFIDKNFIRFRNTIWESVDTNGINDSLTNTWWPSSSAAAKEEKREEQIVVINFTINWPPNFSVTGSEERCI